MTKLIVISSNDEGEKDREKDEYVRGKLSTLELKYDSKEYKNNNEKL